MTYENCKKYLQEAKDEKTKTFWEERIKRKYPQVIEETPKEVSEKPIKKTKKKVKE